MKKIIMVLCIVLMLAAVLGCGVRYSVKNGAHTSVLCLGDSITAGVGVLDPANESYPAQLSKHLGLHYKVLNYGVSGATVSQGTSAYTATRQYKKTLQSEADVIVLALGTNDAREGFFDAEHFEADYRSIVDELAKSLPNAEIILVLPVPINITAFNYSDTILKEHIIPMIQTIAQEKGLVTVDAYTAFAGDTSLLADGLHPNKKGAAALALAVEKAIKS